MMKVYLLSGTVKYEGSDVLGVFATKDIADNIKQKLEKGDKSKSYCLYCYYEVSEFEVLEE